MVLLSTSTILHHGTSNASASHSSHGDNSPGAAPLDPTNLSLHCPLSVIRSGLATSYTHDGLGELHPVPSRVPCSTIKWWINQRALEAHPVKHRRAPLAAAHRGVQGHCNERGLLQWHWVFQDASFVSVRGLSTCLTRRCGFLVTYDNLFNKQRTPTYSKMIFPARVRS
jgi:hypothetical protein